MASGLPFTRFRDDRLPRVVVYIIFMNILVTAGNTIVPIDRVRCITNVFTGRTGTAIALHCHERGHTVTLLSSHPELVAMLSSNGEPGPRWAVDAYRTFADLRELLASKLSASPFDLVIHCAAVNDYEAAGIYAPAPGTCFLPQEARWQVTGPPHSPAFVDRSAGKIKSDEPELWLRLIRTPKLIDLLRSDWGFRGILIKFKLEVGVNEQHLLEIAESSRRQSGAELMVANTLEGASSWALLGPIDGRYDQVSRADLPRRLLDAAEQLYKERTSG
jgi:phosphopantothenoylcysteine synthetase/decarboxylase